MALVEAHSRQKILVVASNSDFHESIRQILCPNRIASAPNGIEPASFGSPTQQARECLCDFHIESAYQGPEALEKVKQAVTHSTPCALAFVDAGMSTALDGIETVNQLWAVQPDLQIIICAACALEDIAARLGHSDNLVAVKKPFDNIEVLQLTRALTRKWHLAQRAQHLISELDTMVSQQTAKLSASNALLHAEIRRREQTEMELRGSEHRFQMAFKASAIPMAIMHAPTQAFLEVNEGFVKLLGREREKILNQSPHDLGMLSDPADCEKAMEITRRNGGVRDHVCSILTEQGDVRDTLLSLEPVVLGEEACLLVAILDITEQKKLEVQLRQSQKMDAIGQLAAGVAHDFNNLLTIIHGYASLQMGRANQDEQTMNSLTQVKLAADRAATLTRQLLAFSRQQVMQFRPLCLRASIEQAQSLLKRLLGETIRLECSCEQDLPPVLADANSIGQVIMNLAVNARDAMPGGGNLHISTKRVYVTPTEAARHPDGRAGDFARLTVADDGCGMDTQTLSRIFEPFFTTKPPGKGTGLGLSTVYGIVKQHSGWMEVESAPGVGTKFHIYLGLTDRRADNLEEEALAPKLTQPNGQHGTILVVEDEPVLREFVTSVLASCGYTVLQAGDGVEAMNIAQETLATIDLLLTDMVMPNGISGRELANRLLAQRSDVKVLFTSGYSQELMDNAERLLSGHNFLPKPFDVSRLLKSVRMCLANGTHTSHLTPAPVAATC